MRADTLREMLRRQPFRPFRLVMSSGRTFDVVSPEWMMIMDRVSAVAVPFESGDGEFITTVDNVQIAHAIPLAA